MNEIKKALLMRALIKMRKKWTAPYAHFVSVWLLYHKILIMSRIFIAWKLNFSDGVKKP